MEGEDEDPHFGRENPWEFCCERGNCGALKTCVTGRDSVMGGRCGRQWEGMLGKSGRIGRDLHVW